MRVYNETFEDLNRLADICLRIACTIERLGEEGNYEFTESIGLGYLASSRRLRNGVKAIVDIQRDYASARSAQNLAEISEEEARKFLQEMFGDEEVTCWNTERKAEIREACQALYRKWGYEEEETKDEEQ